MQQLLLATETNSNLVVDLILTVLAGDIKLGCQLYLLEVASLNAWIFHLTKVSKAIKMSRITLEANRKGNELININQCRTAS